MKLNRAISGRNSSGTEGERGVLLKPVGRDRERLAAMLERARFWVSRTRTDLVEALHQRRRKEREKELPAGERRRR